MERVILINGKINTSVPARPVASAVRIKDGLFEAVGSDAEVLLEWQRAWAHRDTYDAVIALVKEHSGAYGMGVDYVYTMVHKATERVEHGERLAPVPAK